MGHNLKKIIHSALGAVELGYRIMRGIDYQTLSQYILKINQHKDIDGILFEVSQCLKDILDYEVFGFALKNGNTLDIWIDPRVYSTPFTEYITKDFGSQNIDRSLHFFEPHAADSRHNSDAIDVTNLLSYKIMDGQDSARLYIKPKRKMLYYHDSIISTIVNSLTVAVENHVSMQHLKNAAAIDPLTSCYNRRALDCFIKNDIAFAQRTRSELSVIMLDLDNFKDINDVHGHQAGDAVLRDISCLLNSLLRKSDYIARYGGEEFVLILPDTSLYHAVQLSDKIRKKIEEHVVLFEGKKIAITASFGAAALENKAEAEMLLREADERLYKAKSLGKNNVVPSLLPFFADRRFVAQGTMSSYSCSGQMVQAS